MIRQPPKSTLDRSSAASDVYKRQELILEANPDYYVADVPKMQTLDIVFIANDTERANALLGGNIDFATRVGPKDYDDIVATEGLSLIHISEPTRPY